MCGIAGGINVAVSSQTVFAALSHRGPDDAGRLCYDNTELFHTRLAVQDLVGGTQPMEEEEYAIVFNGEIYNHLELRQQLLPGISFRTRSDTETLLQLYRRYGSSMLNDLDGMFALAILDRKRKELFLAVDRAGKKPLFLYREGQRLFFASELNVLDRVLKPRIDEEAIATYLRCGFFPGGLTPYRGVERIANGSWRRINLENLGEEKGRYFSIRDLYRAPLFEGSEAALLEETERRLRRSVKRRILSSDLEVGAFLSGGIDSSLIVAMAAEYTERLKTFTVSFDGGYDEAPLAELTARRYGTQHHTLALSLDLKRDVERILGAYGMPFADSSAIPSWYVSRAAKEHVTVVLNGDGADELFGGYRRYVPFANRSLLRLAKGFSPLGKVLPPPHQKLSGYNYLYRLLQLAGKSGIDAYLSATSDLFEGVYDFGANRYLASLDRTIDSCELKGVSKMLCLDFELLLFGDLLVKMDIATMAHSLEARSPFLGTEILELAPRLPERCKVAGTTTKKILRKLAKRYLPAALPGQPKRGFEVPLKEWVESLLREKIHEALAPGAYTEQFIDRDWIDRLLQGRLRISAEKRAKILWTMYALEIWKEQRR
ncbi:asparagine synthase (glutamine-hydrolyzing) [Nitratifractor sp.]|uniref:asparagine synthase (glutamine-hydrolyzing) n=1 Tax=Nitratifractor sp. TaxID=2268144 RepID=UPI0025EFC1DB|nr:asparagine synthase (glutamine-hydrolyzing) [Nitratifractor sp.]